MDLSEAYRVMNENKPAETDSSKQPDLTMRLNPGKPSRELFDTPKTSIKPMDITPQQPKPSTPKKPVSLLPKGLGMIVQKTESKEGLEKEFFDILKNNYENHPIPEKGLTRDTPIMSYLKDSPDVLEMELLIEANYDINDINIEDIKTFRTFGDVVDYIQVHQGEALKKKSLN